MLSLAAFALFPCVLPQTTPTANLDLKLSTVVKQIPQGQDYRSAFRLEVTNKGKTAARLLQPQDGSAYHWVAPHMNWQFDVKANAPKATEVPRETTPRCGNTNPILKEQFFTLAPGETKTIPLDWIYSRTPDAGTYWISIVMKQIPEEEPLKRIEGPVPDEIIGLYRQLTPFFAQSNRIKVQVVGSGAKS